MLSKKLIPIRGSSCFDATGYFGGRAAFRYANQWARDLSDNPGAIVAEVHGRSVKGKVFQSENKKEMSCGEVAKEADARGCVQSAPGFKNPRS